MTKWAKTIALFLFYCLLILGFAAGLFWTIVNYGQYIIGFIFTASVVGFGIALISILGHLIFALFGIAYDQINMSKGNKD